MWGYLHWNIATRYPWDTSTRFHFELDMMINRWNEVPYPTNKPTKDYEPGHRLIGETVAGYTNTFWDCTLGWFLDVFCYINTFSEPIWSKIGALGFGLRKMCIPICRSTVYLPYIHLYPDVSTLFQMVRRSLKTGLLQPSKRINDSHFWGQTWGVWSPEKHLITSESTRSAPVGEMRVSPMATAGSTGAGRAVAVVAMMEILRKAGRSSIWSTVASQDDTNSIG